MTDEQNEQNERSENLLEDQNPYDLLDEFGRNIVDLRLEGWKYKRLEPVAKAKEGTLRQWFMEGGKYHNAYQWRREQIVKEALEDFSEAEFHLKQGVADAVVVLKAEVANKNWKAAVALLTMVGFNIQKIINETDNAEVHFLKDLIKQYENLSKRRKVNSTNSKTI